MSWQTIDTCPQGQFVLAYFKDGEMVVCRYLDNKEYWTDGDGLDFGYGHDKPTHWMALPEPPPKQP